MCLVCVIKEPFSPPVAPALPMPAFAWPSENTTVIFQILSLLN
jgi:hypothetical protein